MLNVNDVQLAVEVIISLCCQLHMSPSKNDCGLSDDFFPGKKCIKTYRLLARETPPSLEVVLYDSVRGEGTKFNLQRPWLPSIPPPLLGIEILEQSYALISG